MGLRGWIRGLRGRRASPLAAWYDSKRPDSERSLNATHEQIDKARRAMTYLEWCASNPPVARHPLLQETPAEQERRRHDEWIGSLTVTKVDHEAKEVTLESTPDYPPPRPDLEGTREGHRTSSFGRLLTRLDYPTLEQMVREVLDTPMAEPTPSLCDDLEYINSVLDQCDHKLEFGDGGAARCCELEAGHDGDHQESNENYTLTWPGPPVYMGGDDDGDE